MSIAAWWCGTIMSTKSRSTSPEGLICIAAIIFVMAALFSERKSFSSGPAARAAAVTVAKANNAPAAANRERDAEFMGFRLLEKIRFGGRVNGERALTSSSRRHCGRRLALRASAELAAHHLEEHRHEQRAEENRGQHPADLGDADLVLAGQARARRDGYLKTAEQA